MFLYVIIENSRHLFIGQCSYTWVTPLVKILGDDFRLGDEYMTQHVTLKDLLTHRTGTVNFNLPAFAGEPKNLTRAEFTK